jgi:CheY-like chemotaxis protein
LIVDNDIDNVDILTQLMEFHGATVTSADSGRAALEAIDKEHFYCVLTDLQMPDITGWDVLASVRQHLNQETRRTPIIAVTGHALMGDRNRIIEAGFDGYISKPIHPVTFLQTIKAYIDRSSR